MAYAAEHVFSGWCTERANQRWVTSEKFVTGDTLVFKFKKQNSVERVTREDYERCGLGTALYSYDGRETTISPTCPGTGHYICPGSKLCERCIKLEINVDPAPYVSNSSVQPSEATYHPQWACHPCIC